MEQVFKVEGMSCGGCVASVERAVKAVAGVSAVQVRLAEAEATVVFEPQQATVAAIRAAIEAAGFDVPA
ncbi:cation transporter [Chitinimonas viridis]|uniref:Cation transporter n=1 Tax=Chitinimonas viridis TaxID=664880 RepID=A0ABT8B4H8_9NEIS|nr:cation transporter [Chitinimonas viridis]MDN3576730.1 cation transporter [Chitinimonas viridis]